MAYTLSFGIALGASRTGLTLSAQLVSTLGANVGSAVASGFVELGRGNYLWTYSGIPDGFRGAVLFSAGGTLRATAAVNPQEAENLDVKVGQVAESLLTLDLSTISGEAARSILNAIRKLRNKWYIDQHNFELVVYKEDDVTEAYRQSLAATPGASPVTGLG